MEIKINVTLDVTPRLENLAQTALTALMKPLDGKDEELTNGGKKIEETAPEPVAVPVQTEAPEAPQPETVQPEPPEAPEAPAPNPVQPEPPEAPQPEPEQAIPDNETMRILMDIAISKWAGNGSENSKDAATLRKRKDVCNAFKQIAGHLGAEKPTKLEGDARNRFLHEIENNLYYCDGRIEWRPF